MRAPRHLIVAAGLLASTFGARRAAADGFGTPRSASAATWGIATAEAYAALALPLLVTQRTKAATATGATVFGAGVAVSCGVAYLAWRGEADTRLPQGLHGALWTGGELFALGAIAQQRVGPAAIGLGAAGGVTGALVGSLVVRSERGQQIWMLGAPLGFGLGMALVLVEVLPVAGATESGHLSQDKATGILVGSFATLALAGLATSYVGAIAAGKHRVQVSAGLGGIRISDVF